MEGILLEASEVFGRRRSRPAIGDGTVVRHGGAKAKFDWVIALMMLVGIGFMAFGVGRGVFLVVQQSRQEAENKAAIAATIKNYEAWPSARQKVVLKAAEAYNKSINPRAHDLNNDHAGTDAAYWKTLDIGGGVMSDVWIPSISAHVPVRHGTSDQVLSNGAGHMWGTQLPLGEKGDFSAIAAHSGSVQGLFFTRVPELKVGDYFYVNTLGKQTGYKIDTVKEVDPSDTKALRDLYNPDENARVTLVTCTPVGVNTYRLLVSGVAEDDVPPASEAPGDKVWPWGVVLVSGGTACLLLLVWLLKGRARKGKHMFDDKAAIVG